MKRDAIGALAIAGTTALIAIRNRLLIVGLLFTVVLVISSVAAASVSIWERGRLIIDVGLAAASGLGSVMTLAVAIASFAGELRQRTAFIVLVRPVSRSAFVAGKYLGVLGAMVLVVTAMFAATAITVWTFGQSVPGAFWACLWLTWVELAVVGAIAMVFSTLAGPVLAAGYTVALVIAGNLSDDILALAERTAKDGGAAAAALWRTLYWILPDLQALSLRSQAANELPVPPGYVAQGTLYGVCYAVATLTVAMWIFSRRRVV